MDTAAQARQAPLAVGHPLAPIVGGRLAGDARRVHPARRDRDHPTDTPATRQERRARELRRSPARGSPPAGVAARAKRAIRSRKRGAMSRSPCVGTPSALASAGDCAIDSVTASGSFRSRRRAAMVFTVHGKLSLKYSFGRGHALHRSARRLRTVSAGHGRSADDPDDPGSVSRPVGDLDRGRMEALA